MITAVVAAAGGQAGGVCASNKMAAASILVGNTLSNIMSKKIY